MSVRVCLWAAALAASVAGCGGGDRVSTDVDAGFDGGTDAGPPDAGPAADAGPTDAGPPTSDAGPCTTNADCPETHFCDGETCDGPGTCAIRPELSSCRDVAVVCGCDDSIYGNECRAHSVGMRVAHEGECDRPPACTDNGDCAADEYCAREPESCRLVTCYARRDSGECLPRPTSCSDPSTQVCGCDGVTYASCCEAQMAGVNVIAPGECPDTPLDCRTYGCTGDNVCRECLPGEYICMPPGVVCS